MEKRKRRYLYCFLSHPLTSYSTNTNATEFQYMHIHELRLLCGVSTFCFHFGRLFDFLVVVLSFFLQLFAVEICLYFPSKIIIPFDLLKFYKIDSINFGTFNDCYRCDVKWLKTLLFLLSWMTHKQHPLWIHWIEHYLTRMMVASQTIIKVN